MKIVNDGETPIKQTSDVKINNQVPLDITIQSIDETIPIVLYQALIIVC